MNAVTPKQFLTGLRHARLLAIIRGQDAESSIRAAVTLLEEGFHYLEISLNTVDAARVIEAVVREAPAGSFVGGGTVLSLEDVAVVHAAGGQFMVTPAIAPSVTEAARRGIPVLAGAMTPSEAYAGMSAGATAIKLFPASAGGPGYLKALRDPLPNVPFVAVGGVNATLAAQFFANGAIAVGLGSPLVGDATSGGSLDALRERARRYLEVAAEFGAVNSRR